MSLSVVEFSPYVSQLEKFHSFLRFEMKKKSIRREIKARIQRTKATRQREKQNKRNRAHEHGGVLFNLQNSNRR